MLVAALLAASAACTRSRAARVSLPAPPAPAGTTETGIASWYGAPYDGRPAASGSIYDMEQLTAAHRTLAFGTRVEVTNLANGRRVNVVITDRGPFVDGRVIDLSRAAARAIDMLGPGTARVRLMVIAAPAPASSDPVSPAKALDRYAVQAGSFTTAERAESFRATLQGQFAGVRVVNAGPLWRVVIGHSLTLGAANDLASRVRETAGAAIVIRDP